MTERSPEKQTDQKQQIRDSRMHLLIVSNTESSKSISGADRDWVNLLNAHGPQRVRVTWVGIENAEGLREYIDQDIESRFLNIPFEPFYELFHQSMYRQRSLSAWARIISASLLRLRRPVAQLLRLMRADPPDVVITNTSVVWLGAAYAKRARIPHVWCVKEFLDPAVAASRKFARAIEKLSDAVVVPSQAMAAAFSKRVRVLHDGNDLSAIRNSTNGVTREQVLESLGLPAAQPVIAQTGALSWAKGQQVTALACAQLALEGQRPCSILFLGSGEQAEKEKLFATLDQAPLQWGASMRFLEFRPGEFSYLSAADIVVHPSVLPDPYPNAVREALILGKPVIGSRLGGIPQLVSDGVNGILVEPNDSEELAEALKRLIDSPEERARMGGEARQFAEKHLDIKVCREKFYDLLVEVSQGGPKGP
jgi:glycosyltransferase involved in cell wall biosynthesis